MSRFVEKSTNRKKTVNPEEMKEKKGTKKATKRIREVKKNITFPITLPS